MAKKPKGCPHDGRPIKWRGVCTACYFAGRRDIASGAATDEQLVQLGFWKPSERVIDPATYGKSRKVLDKLLGK